MDKAHLLVDSFTGSIADATKWVPFGPVAQAAAVFCSPAPNTAGSYCGYTSAANRLPRAAGGSIRAVRRSERLAEAADTRRSCRRAESRWPCRTRFRSPTR